MREVVTEYAKRGDLHIAYQVLGNGPHDLVLVPNWFTNVEANWDIPRFPEYLRGLASFSRLIVFDQLGTGLSDRGAGRGLTFESWGEDLRSVLEAVGSERATVSCFDTSGAAGMFLAATYPDRVSSLILTNCFARFLRAPDYPAGLPVEKKDPYLETVRRMWGGMTTLPATAPSVADDPEIIAEWARYERIIVAPGDFRDTFSVGMDIDVRDILPSIKVPTLVLQSRDNQYVRAAHGRYLADHIPGSKYVKLDSADHFFWFSSVKEYLAEIEEFVTGSRPPRINNNRVLTTLLFTDIVGSTEQLAKLGDNKWREVLDRHDETVRSTTSRYGGNLIKFDGDGALATFDGPARALMCALDLGEQMKRIGIQIRSGLHTGEVEQRGKDVAGMAVHVASRIKDAARPSELLASSTVKELVIGSGLRFDEGKRVRLKGVPDEWTLHRCLGVG